MAEATGKIELYVCHTCEMELPFDDMPAHSRSHNAPHHIAHIEIICFCGEKFDAMRKFELHREQMVKPQNTYEYSLAKYRNTS